MVSLDWFLETRLMEILKQILQKNKTRWCTTLSTESLGHICLVTVSFQVHLGWKATAVNQMVPVAFGRRIQHQGQ